MGQLFSGLKVVDCASFIAAPSAATILSDFGADVIKIEPPGAGDGLRSLYVRVGAPSSDKDYGWMMDSRNKRDIAIDLRTEGGLAVLHRLVDNADVFLTNMPLGSRRRMKIGYEDLSPRNPKLIYASFTAYGEVGAEAEKTGFDTTAYWARSGLMDLIRPHSESPPARSVAGLGDHPCGMTLYAAIVTALYRRQMTGRGGLVHSSLLAGGLWANSNFVHAQLVGAEIPKRPPREHLPNPLSNVYRTKDNRWFALAMVNEVKQWPMLVKALERPELQDIRFATPAGRREHATEVIKSMDDAIIKHDLAFWRAHLDKAGITFGVVGTLDDIEHDEQMKIAKAIVPYADGSGYTVANPINIEGEEKTVPRMAPDVGQDTDEILREAGYSAAEIAKLREDKSVA
jgi:crotonobetainyl-CoA:carnitine CoA-transferase CaiB-like acyl-CoA transferase